MSRVTVQKTVTVEVEITPAELAEFFCALDDEQQAQFFVECDRIARSWVGTTAGHGHQWWLVGRHLATCTCSNDDARDMIRELAAGIRSGEEAMP